MPSCRQPPVYDTMCDFPWTRWRQLIWEERTWPAASFFFIFYFLGALFLPVAFVWSAYVSGLKRTKAIYAWWALNDNLMIGNRWQTSDGGVRGFRSRLRKASQRDFGRFRLSDTLLHLQSICPAAPFSFHESSGNQRPSSWALRCIQSINWPGGYPVNSADYYAFYVLGWEE